MAVAFWPTTFSVAASGAGRPVLFLPGAATPGEIWGATLAHLGGRVRAHVVTIRGFGGGEPTASPLLPAVRAELARYLRARAAGAVVVGHSLGAALGFWLAASEPGLLGGLVAVDAPPFSVALDTPDATAASFEPRARRLREALLAMSPDDVRGWLRSSFLRMATDPQQAERIAAMAARSSPRAVADALYDLYTLDLREQVASLSIPVLALVAGSGLLSGPRSAYELRWRAQIERIPRHELVVFPDARHFLMIDAPDAFHHHLDAFLASCP